MRDIHDQTFGFDLLSTSTLVRHGPRLRHGARLLTLILLSLAFAAFTGACAQVRFHLPFTPVPVTGQVFAVLVCGALLGPAFGSLSQFFYIALGIAGVPWFVLGPIGPTGGYIAGFVLAPTIIGSLLLRGKGSVKRTFFAMLAGLAAIYFLGLIQFSLFMKKEILDSVLLAVLPFIPFDLLKALFAALATRPFTRWGDKTAG